MPEQNKQEEKREDESKLRWYVVHTYTGHEKRVKANIEHLAEMEGVAEKIDRVLIPLRKMIEPKGGKQKEVYRNIMPGYVFLHMEPDPLLFNIIQKVNSVTSFLGPEGKPEEISEEEVNKVLEAIRERTDRQKVVVKFQEGDQVRVTQGPFQNFIGTVQQVEEDKGKLKVAVSIFGRNTLLELDVLQVEEAQ
jgi:transcriptional antiterminator NusG